MNTHQQFTSLVVAQREVRDNYRTLISAVLPRPIGFISTISSEGAPNLAPFSFFNAVGANPPALMFSPCNRADGSLKDTVVNLSQVGEFVVNVVPYEISHAMNQASFSYPPQVSEFEAAGFTPLASTLVKPFRVAQSPVHMECRLVDVVKVGEGPLSANVCIGEVLCFHVADGFLLDDGTIDVSQIDLVGRLGGPDYATIRDRFALPKPTAEPPEPGRSG